VDASGNVFVAGTSGLADYTADYVTIKYSSAGAPLWTRRYNGPNNGSDAAFDDAKGIAVDTNGDVVVTGYSSSGTGTGNNYATIKYSSAGVPLWTNRYNGPANGEDMAGAVALDSNGNVYVTGFSAGSGTGSDYATIAYSSAGVPLWTNRYNGRETALIKPAVWPWTRAAMCT